MSEGKERINNLLGTGSSFIVGNGFLTEAWVFINEYRNRMAFCPDNPDNLKYLVLAVQYLRTAERCGFKIDSERKSLQELKKRYGLG